MREILQFFECDHLPQSLREVASKFEHMAHDLKQSLAPCRELLKSLDALLVAKDAAVRAALLEAKLRENR